MNRDEFLRTLREALSGEIPPNIIEENIRYYDAYIADEVRKGRTEEEVIEELGGARVIAKTIIDVAAAGGDAGTGDPYGDAWQESAYGGGGSGRQSSSGGYGSGSAGGYSSGGYGSGGAGGDSGGDGFDPFGFGSREEQHRRGIHIYNLDKWYWRLLLWVVILLILFVFMYLVMGLATLLWPFIVVALVIWLVRSMTR